MNGLKYLFLGAGLSLLPACGVESASRHWDTVYYADFNVDPITGYSEENIEQSSCIFKIDSQKFAKILNRSSGQYESRNVRAKVIRYSGSVIFIDADGNARGSGAYYTVNKVEFENLLQNKERCLN